MSDPILAAIQAAPVHFDREASTDKACALIAEAGRLGADVAAFGESWLPGYPLFAFSAPSATRWRASSSYLAAAVLVPGRETERLCIAARRARIDVVIGIVELDSRTLGTTYATLLFIGRDGTLLGKHRKLKPTFHERTAWGDGDADGLVVYPRSYGRLSGLNCWEHQMMLPGYVLASQGTQVHVAAWPGRELEMAPEPPTALWPRQTLLSRAFASQAAAYVICAAGINRRDDYPEEFRELVTFESNGGSCIIDPRGEIIAGPVVDREVILTAPMSTPLARSAKAAVDIGAHYARPDIFSLSVHRPNR